MNTIQQLHSARRYLEDMLKTQPAEVQQVAAKVKELDRVTLIYIDRLIETTKDEL